MVRRGVTLIELLVAISITAILTGIVVFTLRAGLDAYSFGQEQALLGKALDDCLEEIAGGGFESYGIKDALEVLTATPASISFVPLWIDDSHSIPFSVDLPSFTLNRPFKAGASLPLAEVFTAEGKWKAVPITFVAGAHKNPKKPDDRVYLNTPQDPENKIRFVFQPDVKHFPDCVMTIRWAGDRITRKYKGKTEDIPKDVISGVSLSDFGFQYFDNTNTEVSPQQKLIPNITAIKLNLEASITHKTKRVPGLKKQGFVFMNIRNSRVAGVGLIIREGTRFKIPDSRHIRVFSLTQVTGIRPGGRIELEARPKKGVTWKIRIHLGLDDKTPLLKRYAVEYPPGRTVYSEAIDLSTDLPLNFLTLGGNGRYDYDFDKEGNNMVNLEGEVELVVTKMDATGAALFVRP